MTLFPPAILRIFILKGTVVFPTSCRTRLRVRDLRPQQYAGEISTAIRFFRRGIEEDRCGRSIARICTTAVRLCDNTSRAKFRRYARRHDDDDEGALAAGALRSVFEGPLRLRPIARRRDGVRAVGGGMARRFGCVWWAGAFCGAGPRLHLRGPQRCELDRQVRTDYLFGRRGPAMSKRARDVPLWQSELEASLAFVVALFPRPIALCAHSRL